MAAKSKGNDPKGQSNNGNNGIGAGGIKLNGTQGDDILIGTAENDAIIADKGDDVVQADAGNDLVQGGPGDDDISGGPGDDHLNGGTGDDVVSGGAGDDKVDGGPGDDVLDGGGGDDKVSGGPGSDGLQGGDGDDWVKGGPSDDVVDGGAGSDRVDGGAGNDLAIYNMAENTGAADRYDGGSGIDTLLLEFTYDEWMRDDVQADVARFLTFLEEHTDPVTGEADGERFYFESFDLSARKFEDFRITVDGVEQDPRDEAVVAADDSAVTETEESAVSGSVLDNDSVPDLVRSVELVDSSPKGSMTFRPDGTFTYDPGDDFDHLAEGETEDVIFTYRVTDADHDSDIGTITITVTGTNDAPIAVADVGGTDEDTAVTIDVLANDTDVDLSDTHTVDAVSVASGGGSAAIINNQVVYDPGADYQYLAVGESASVALAYTMSDNHGAESSSTVSLTITGNNDGPVAVADTGGTDEDTSVTIDVLANDTDVDLSDTHTVDTVSVSSGGGSVTIVENQVIYDPGDDYQYLAVGETETVTLAYTMSDNHEAESASTVSLTITGTNDGPVAVADSGGTDEDTAVTIDVLANDTDVDLSDTHTVDVVSVTSGGGSASIVANQVVYDPGADYQYLAVGETAEVELAYTMSDNHLASSSSTVNLTITGTNDGPVAVADTDTTDENAAITVDVLANDTDKDRSDAHTVDTVSVPAGQGTVAIVANQVEWTPGADFDYLAVGESATVTVNYTMSDNHGAASSSTATLTVTGSNDGPVTVADSATTNEDTAIVIPAATLLANDSDVDLSDVLTVTSVGSAVNGTVALDINGDAVFTPTADYSGPASFDYTLSDGHGGVSTATVSIDVEAVADTPTLTVSNADIYVDSVIPLDITSALTDVDGSEILTVTISGIPSGSTLSAGTQIADDGATATWALASGDLAGLTLSPAANSGGVVTLSVTATATESSNGDTASTTATMDVTINRPPTAFNDALSSLEDAQIIIPAATLIANDVDPDPGDVLSITAVENIIRDGSGNAVGSAVLTLAGDVLFTPIANWNGVANFDYTVSDRFGETSTATVAVDVAAVNDDPTAVADSATTDENAAVSVDVLANDTDVDFSDTPTLETHTLDTVSVPAGQGTVAIVANQVTWTPGTDFDYLALGESATVSIDYTMSDNDGASSSSTVTLSVTGSNDSPVAMDDTLGASVGTDSGGRVNVAVVYGSSPESAMGAVNQLNDSTVFNFNATAVHVSGADTLQELQGYDAVIHAGNYWEGYSSFPAGYWQALGDYIDGNHGGVLTTGWFNYTLPRYFGGSATVDGVTPVAENATHVNAYNGNLTLLDPSHPIVDGLPSSFQAPGYWNGAVSIDAAAVNLGAISSNAGQSYIVYTDEVDSGHTVYLAGMYGDASFYSPELASGPADQLFEQAVNWVSESDTSLTDEDTAITITAADLIGNDVDLDASDELLVADVSAASAQGASVSIDGNGNVAYDPSGSTALQALVEGETATDSFTYRINDGHVDSNWATVTFTVTGSNDGPVAIADSATTDENAAITLDVLANDTDADLSDTHTLDSVSVAAGQGTVSIVANQAEWQPGADFDYLAVGESATVTVNYTMSDNHGAASSSTATLTITGSNDGPVANVDGVFTTDEDTVITLDVLANDTDVDVSDTHTVKTVSVTSGLGSASVVGSQVVYDPGNDYQYLAVGESETVVLTYTMSDNHGAESTATLTLTVTGTNDGPVAVADAAATPEDTAIVIPAADLLVNDTDVDASDVLTVTAVANAVNGSVALDAAGNVVFEPGADFSGEATFDYTASDGNGGTSTATVKIDVSAVADAPTVTATDTVASIAAPEPVTLSEGPEFVASATTSGNQQLPAVQTLTDGTFVITWNSFGQDGSDSGIFGQHYAADGGKIGGEFQVNSHTTGHQGEPSMTALDDGGFVVAWHSLDQDGSGWGVFGQRFTADGSPAGNEFPIHSYPAGHQVWTDMTTLSDGSFVATWSSQWQDGSQFGSYGQRFAADGSKIGGEFQINTTTYEDQANPDVTALDDGGFVVAWRSYLQDGNHGGVFGRLYDADGAPVTGEFQINTHTLNDQGGPKTTTLADGGFVVIWNSAYQDGSKYGVYGQRFDADGDKVDGEFHLNEAYTYDEQFMPEVEALADGGFVAMWQSWRQDGSKAAVIGRRYDADGNTVGDGEFIVNDTTYGDQARMGISARDDGGFVVAWTDFDGHDGSGQGVFAKVYEGSGVVSQYKTAALDISVALTDTDGSESISSIVVSGLPDGAQLSAGTDLGGGRWALATDDLAGLTVSVPAIVAGDFPITVEVTSSEASNGSSAQTSGSFVLSVQNTAPTALPDSGTTDENAAITVDVLANDTDMDPSDTHTVDTVSVPAGQGTVSIVANQVVWNPGTDFDYLALGETATVTVGYTMSDNYDASSSATLTLTVTGSNDAPTVSASLISNTDVDSTPYVINLLDGAHDVDNGFVIHAVNVMEASGKGGWTIDGDELTIDPGYFDAINDGEFETLEFNYQVMDEKGAVVDQSLSVNVQNNPDVPSISVHALAGNLVNEIQLSITTEPAKDENVRLTFNGLPAGAIVLDAFNNNVTSGVANSIGTHLFTVVLPEGQATKTDISVSATGIRDDGEIIGEAVDTVDLSYAVSTTFQMVNFGLEGQNMWGSGDNIDIGWHEYIPFVGTETEAWSSGVFNIFDIDISTDAIGETVLGGLQSVLDTALDLKQDAADSLGQAQADADLAYQEAVHVQNISDDYAAYVFRAGLYHTAKVAYDAAKWLTDGAYNDWQADITRLNNAENHLDNLWSQYHSINTYWFTDWFGTVWHDPIKLAQKAAKWLEIGGQKAYILVIEADKAITKLAYDGFKWASDGLYGPMNDAEVWMNEAYQDMQGHIQEMNADGIYYDHQITILDATAAWADYVWHEGEVLAKEGLLALADTGVFFAQGAYDVAEGAVNTVDAGAQLQMDAELYAQVGLQVDFDLDLGSVGTDTDYQLGTETQYNLTTDMLQLTPTMTNMTTGDSVAFSTISPNATFYAAILYDVGANIDMVVDAYARVAGTTLFDVSPNSDGIIIEENIGIDGEIVLVDFDSTETDTVEVPFIETVSEGIVSINLNFPTIETEGTETAYSSSYFEEGDLINVDFSEISSAFFSYIESGIDFSPEMKAAFSGLGSTEPGSPGFDAVMESASTVLEGIWSLLDGSADTDGDGVVPIFLVDATDETSTSLLHLNLYPDDLSGIDANTGSFGFYASYGESEPVVEVSIDIDQFVALVANVALGNASGEVINPLDIDLGLDLIFDLADVPTTVSDEIKKYVQFNINIQAADLDAYSAWDFSQEFTLSIDDMIYSVTMENDELFTFAANDTDSLLIENASQYDVNNDGVVAYDLELMPEAMFSNDTEVGMSIGYTLDFIKASAEAGLNLPFADMLGIPGLPEIDIPMLDTSMGPLLRVQGELDVLDVDVYESRFAMDMGTDEVAGGVSAIDDTLVGSAGEDTLDGQEGRDILSGGDGNDVLSGGAGDDLLFGGAGDDLFIFADNSGNDTVNDFQGGAGAGDQLDITDFLFADFAAVEAATTQVGADTIIQLDEDDTITLLGVNKESLEQDDFLL